MLIISVVIIVPLSIALGWKLKWWYLLILYSIFQYIGKFLYVYFSGINISEIQFLDTDTSRQEFIMNYQLGISMIFCLYGEFDNSVGIKEVDLLHIIYNQTTRKMLNNTIKHGNVTEIVYDYQGQKLKVLFKK